MALQAILRTPVRLIIIAILLNAQEGRSMLSSVNKARPSKDITSSVKASWQHESATEDKQQSAAALRAYKNTHKLIYIYIECVACK